MKQARTNQAMRHQTTKDYASNNTSIKQGHNKQARAVRAWASNKQRHKKQATS